MKILLVGEYNRSHKFLKEGLNELGHETTVIGLRDGFKKVDIDIEIKDSYRTGFRRKIKNVIYALFNFDLHSWSVKQQILRHQKRLSGYDIVQFINESPFLCRPKVAQELFDFLRQWNNKTFLLSCGTDYISVKYAYEQKFRYSILTPYFEKKAPKKTFVNILKYLQPGFKELHKHIYKHIDGVLASDLDYHIPLENHPKYLGMVPNPIQINLFEFQPLSIIDKIIIFHGINGDNYYKKGNDLFEKALDIIEKKYSEKIEIISVTSLPYKEYIKSFDKAHIVLDMVYAYDQGFNALEAMAKGKVVFTGAEIEWEKWYNVEADTIAINALPDYNLIAQKIEWLILNPEKITEISNNARNFIIKEHDHVQSAQVYLDKWINQF